MNSNYGNTAVTEYKKKVCLRIKDDVLNILTDNDTGIQMLKIASLRKRYPETDEQVCVALMLTNLAQPEWVTVGCDQPLTVHAVCVVPFVMNTSSQRNNHNDRSELYKQGSVDCHFLCIQKDNTCSCFCG